MSLLVAFMFAVVAAILVFLIVEPMIEGATRAREQFVADAKMSLADMFLFLDLERLVTFSIAAIFVVTLILFLITGSLVLPIIVAILLSFSPKFTLKFLKQRRKQTITNQLPDFLIGVSSSMTVGMGLSQALEVTSKEESGPLGQEFDLFLNELRLGVTFDDALDGLDSRIDTEEIKLVVAAMKISREVGGNLSEVLKRLSETLRTKLEMENKIKTLTAQGRLQGIVMVGLPIVVGISLYFMESTHIYVVQLFTEWYGWATLAFLTAMLSIGYFFIRKIVNIDV